MSELAALKAGLGADRYWAAVLRAQAGILDREQARRAGFTREQIAHRLESGAWQRVHTAVYATFSGPLPREARLWAAVRWAGLDAMVSHETAAESHGLADRQARAIHIMVPVRRRPAQRGPVHGIVIHRSDQSHADFVGPFKLPRTRIEDTVLDLVAAAPDFDRGYTWVAAAVSRQLATAGELRAALAARNRVRWRGWLNDALDDARAGSHSPLERRYVRDVEQAHGLPRSRQQERRELGGKAHYRDIWYADYRVAVEIDGPSYHQNERVQLDKDRDNANLAVDDVRTFRFGPVGVTERACATAVLVATTLRRSGWNGAPRQCRRPRCAVASDVREDGGSPGVL
jgi:hypothetical protein